MNYTEFRREFYQKTTVQKNELERNFSNIEISFYGSIVDIKDDRICLVEIREHSYDDFPTLFNNTTLLYKNEIIKNELKYYNIGDDVNTTAEFLRIIKGNTDEFEFEIKSISKTGTTWSSRREFREKQLEDNSCFIATACYGDYNSTEVKVLRFYRDTVMLKHFIGRILIKTYYLLSPPIAGILERSETLKAFTRKYILTPIIQRIKQKQ